MTVAVHEHIERVKLADPQNLAWWEALFTWADNVRETFLFDPRHEQESYRVLLREIAEKSAHQQADALFTAFSTLRAGRFRETLQTSGLRFAVMTRKTMLGPASLQYANLALNIQAPIAARWRSGSVTKMFVSSDFRQDAPNGNADSFVAFYERHRSNSLAQTWFIAHAERATIRPGKPRSLKQLGKIRNAEYRRALVRVYGVKGSGEPVQRDDYGALYLVDDDTRAVFVTCPSTGRQYWLGVPATCETAREAVLWSFDLKPNAELLQEA